MKKRVLIINTGGTISSVRANKGYEPKVGFVAKCLKSVDALNHKDMPDFSILEYQPLLDSSNMDIDDWNKIAKDVANNYDHFDGFVILHGTDTMAYTASALSFMLENLSKPVILTGSQIPLSEPRNDAIDNIITSLWLCTQNLIHEVCVLFHQKLLRGNRCRKTSAQQFDAFSSPNLKALAKIGIDIQFEKNLLLKRPEKPFHLQPITTHEISNFRLFPGFEKKVLSFLFNQPIKGLVLETYGAGNAPNQDETFLNILRQASNQGIIIVNCSQCQQGLVSMEQYATGHTLKDAGLISGYDMTPEAAHCKLLYLFSKFSDVELIKSQMMTNLCGELTALI